QCYQVSAIQDHSGQDLSGHHALLHIHVHTATPDAGWKPARARRVRTTRRLPYRSELRRQNDTSPVETDVVTDAFCDAPVPVFWLRACKPAKFWNALPEMLNRLSAVVALSAEAL